MQQWRRVQCQMRKSSLPSKPLMTVKKLHFHLAPEKFKSGFTFSLHQNRFPCFTPDWSPNTTKKISNIFPFVECVSTSVESMVLCFRAIVRWSTAFESHFIHLSHDFRQSIGNELDFPSFFHGNWTTNETARSKGAIWTKSHSIDAVPSWQRAMSGKHSATLFVF